MKEPYKDKEPIPKLTKSSSRSNIDHFNAQ